MPKFADTPYFLLDHYLNTVNQQTTDDIISKVENLWPVLFTDIDLITTWENYNDVDFNFEYETVEGSYSKKHVSYSYDESMLIGGKKGIIASGGRIIKLFVKDDDYGFREINVTPPWKDYADGNFFQFHKHITLPYQYGSTMTETLSGEGYYFEVWTPTVMFDPDDINGKEVYFRKDSQFHNWLINYAKDFFIEEWQQEFIIRNYVNTDKQFLYFGPIYHKHDDEYHIEFYGMKDFVELAVPYHQRTDKFKQFVNIHFDRVYQEVYNLLKNIWSMIDPFEVDEKFLGYLSRFYNINVDNQVINVQAQREFIRELSNYLKRKGGYSSFFAAWKVLTSGTKNPLYIYEKWLPKRYINETLPISASEYQEVLYTDQYNDTQTFPLSGTVDDWILTPYYKIQMDLSTEPIEREKILSKGVITSLLNQFEDIRPVNKISEYEIIIKPESNLIGTYKGLYDGNQDKYNTNVLSKVLKFSVTVENAYIQLFGGSYTSFLATHNLNSNHLFIKCYTDEFKEVIPKDVIFIDEDTINVTFNEPINGFMLIKKPDMTVSQLIPSTDTWIIKHPFETETVYVEFNQDNDKVYADELIMIDDEFFETDLKSGTINVSNPDMLYIQQTASNVWEINHNLGYKGLLISCFDINNNEIIPKDIKFIDINNCIIYFEEPLIGHAVMLTVGSPLFADQLINNGNLPNFAVSSTIDSFVTTDYYGKISNATETNEFLYITIDLPQSKELTVREVKIYNDDNSILFYTECGEIHKPMNVKMKLEYKINKYITEGSS